MLEGGGLGGFPLVCTAAVSKHETDILPGTVDVSKHEICAVTTQRTGTLQFMVAFALRGGGCHTSANISRFVASWEAGGPSPNQHASDLCHNF